MADPKEAGDVGAGSPATLAATVAAQGIRDPRLLEAIAAIPRAGFVPHQVAHLAYHDTALRIGHEQVTTQPSLSARMIEGLGLHGTETVLEVGTGYGFQTALLARLARRVWSVERWPDLAEAARDNLARAGITNAEVVVGDGSEGLAAHAPYDAVLVSAAFPSVPPPLAGQLGAGGRLVQPIGSGGAEDVTLFVKEGDVLVARQSLTAARFVPLRGTFGFADEGR